MADLWLSLYLKTSLNMTELETLYQTNKDRLSAMAVECTVLTPLHIGDGNSYSPLTDFVVKSEDGQDWVQFINKAQSFSQILGDPEKTAQYLDTVRAYTNKNKAAFFQSPLFAELKTDIVVYKQRVPYVEAEGQPQPQEFSSCIKSNGNWYIPGSTIKGALCNIRLAAILRNRQYGKGVKNMLDDLNSGSEKINWTSLSKLNKFIEQRCTEYERRFLHAEDFISGNQETQIIKCFRYSQKYDDSRVPLCYEVIPEGQVVHGQLSYNGLEFLMQHAQNEWFLRKNGNQSDFKKHKSRILQHETKDTELSNAAYLCRLANQFAKEQLEAEIAEVEKFGTEIWRMYESHLNQLLQLCNSLSGKECLIRLGAGKWYFHQTVALWLKKELHSDVWETYLKWIDKKYEEGGVFPRSRVFTGRDSKPMGWIKIAFN
ncbi:MAG: type III-A CRISPR-associated RAMP protein Csm5 [Bacteroidetes bacterium]|nr:type III-A CRISPR-associated RAMP protein Csm5 [Bacteroidota bacterium]